MNVLHMFDGFRRRISAECLDDEPTICLRDGQQTVFVQVTPRVLLQLRAALNEAGKYHAVEEA